MTEYYGTHVTNMVATPPVVVDSRMHGGQKKFFADAFEIADNGNGDYIVLFRMPVDAIMDYVKVACDDLTSGTFNIGLYKADGDGTFTAVAAECFASDVALNSGAVALTDYTFEAAATNIVNGIKTLWEWAGLSARPAYNDLYLALTFDTGTGATGTMYVKSEIVV